MFWHTPLVDSSAAVRRHAPIGIRRRPREPAEGPWAAGLSQLSRQPGVARIVTNSLADLALVRRQLDRRSQDIWLICHTGFENAAIEIKNRFPGAHIALRDRIYYRLLLIAPRTVYLVGAGTNGAGCMAPPLVFQTRDAHDACLEESFAALWQEARELG